MAKVLIELFAVLVVFEIVFAFDLLFEIVVELLVEIVLFKLVDDIEIQTIINNGCLDLFTRNEVVIFGSLLGFPGSFLGFRFRGERRCWGGSGSGSCRWSGSCRGRGSWSRGWVFFFVYHSNQSCCRERIDAVKLIA